MWQGRTFRSMQVQDSNSKGNAMSIINTEVYASEKRTAAVDRKIARARLFAAVEGTKGKVFPTPPHQSPLTREIGQVTR